MDKERKIELGDRVKDKVSGYIGVVVAVTIWLNGCARMGIQAETVKKDEQPQDVVWIDEFQLKLVRKAIVKTVSRETGGPRSEPQRAGDPRRR